MSSTRSSARRPHSATRCERNSSPTETKSPSPTNCSRRAGTSCPARPDSRSRASSARSRNEVRARRADGPATGRTLQSRRMTPPSHRLPEPDRPWMMRTYSGHSSAEASNALYRANLAQGQTGLSVAFDLPTQTGYDPDHELARGEVGKVGVPVAHRGDMKTLLDGIPLDAMNTSMTINAT